MSKKHTLLIVCAAATAVAVWLAAARPDVVYEVRYTCEVLRDANAVASFPPDGNFCRQSGVAGDDGCLSRAHPESIIPVLRIVDSIKRDAVVISNIESKVSCRGLNTVGHEKFASMLSSMDVSSEVSGNRCVLLFSVCDKDAETANLFMDAYFCTLSELVRDHNERLVERSMLQTRTGIEKIKRKLQLLRSTENCDVGSDTLKDEEKKLARLASEESRIKSELKRRVLNIRLIKTETTTRNCGSGSK